MDSLIINVQDSYLKLSVDDQDLNEKRLNQDLPDKDKRSLKSLRIQDMQQFPRRSKSYYDYYEEEECLKKPRIDRDRFDYFINVIFGSVMVIMFILLIAMITLAIEEKLKATFANNYNNNSVAIFTPNGVLQVESYTLNNNVFVGFVKKTNGFTSVQ